MNQFVQGLLERQKSSSGLQNVTLENFNGTTGGTLVVVKALSIADQRFLDNTVQTLAGTVWLTESRKAITGVTIVARCARSASNGSLLFVDEFHDDGSRRSEQDIDAQLLASISTLVNGWRDPPEDWIEWGDQILKKLDPNASPAPEEPDEPVVVDEKATAAAQAQLENTLDSIEKNS